MRQEQGSQKLRTSAIPSTKDLQRSIPPHGQTRAFWAEMRSAYVVRSMACMTRDDLEARLTTLARQVFALCAEVRTVSGGKNAADQLQKSSSSAASNYSASRRARSRKEFIAKLGQSAEEANETVGWIHYIETNHLAHSHRIAPLLDEAMQLRAILAASYRTARANYRRQMTKSNHQITK